MSTKGTYLQIAAGLVVLVVLGVAVVLVPNPVGAAVAGGLYDATLDSTLTYRVQVWSDTPLTDLTLIVPLPGGEEGRELVSGLARGEMTGRPQGWHLTILEAGNLSMLEIRADRFGEASAPLTGREGVALTSAVLASPGPWTEDLQVQVRPGRLIATDAPEGREPLLLPRYNITSASCGCGGSEGRTEHFVYDGTIFAEYRAPQNASMGVWVQVRGMNRWWAYHWSSNYYSDNLRLLWQGSPEGWISVQGRLSRKAGRYGRPTGF